MFEEPHEHGTRHCVLQIYAQWSDRHLDVIWESEEVDYFWILEEAKKRYSECRKALAEMGFVYSDMDW